MSALASSLRRSAASPRLRGLRRCLTLWAPLTLFTVVTLFPFYWMLVASAKSNDELFNLKAFPFWVASWTAEHYAYLFTQTRFWEWMKNTLGISIAATAISLAFSVLAGYALARLRFRGAGLLGLLIFVSYLVPQTLLFIPLYDVIVSLGLTNTPWSLVLTYPTFLIPFCAWLLMGYFKSIPKELEESALIDGSSRVGTIWRIVLPLALPGLLSAGIFAFTLSWNEYLYALVFITDPALKTVAVGAVSELIRGDGFFWGELMAGALLACLPVAVAYAFLVDYYVAGLTAGAVKG